MRWSLMCGVILNFCHGALLHGYGTPMNGL
jgi:hypothetical protein